MRTRLPHRILSAVLLLCALPTAASAAQVATRAPWLLAAADADGDDVTTREEWQAFGADLPRSGEVLDRGVLLARAMRPYLDPEGSGELRRAALVVVLDALDTSGDGEVSAEELGAASSLGREWSFLDQVLRVAADGDLDGRIVAAERGALLEGLPEVLGDEHLAALLALARRGTTADRNAMSASVILLGNDSALDADLDGRVTRADLEAHFAALDGDGDGRVTAQERRSSAPRAGGDDFRVSAEAHDPEARMPWQRNLEDALLLSRRTGKPLLLCVNMDGETFCDQLALGRYRNTEFIELARGFVPLVASPDRRNPFDHDDRGARIPDPRFGRVTTSEAIDIEPALYERYFAGRRVAPRHVGVSPEGEVLFDIFLVQDLAIVDRALRRHGVHDGPSVSVGSEDEEALLGSPDAGDRALLEQLFLDGDRDLRERLARRSLSAEREVQHVQLLRQALHDHDADVRRAALSAIATRPEVVPLELFVRARAVALGDEDAVMALEGALERRRAAAPDGALAARAGRLLAAWRATRARPALFDPGHWSLVRELEGALPSPSLDGRFDEVVELLERAMDRLAADRQDPVRLADGSAAQLLLGDASLATGGNPSFAYQDALDLARRARAADPGSARAAALEARAAYLLGDQQAATRAAAEALPGLTDAVASPLATGTLEVLARGYTGEVYGALREGRELPADLLPDLLAAWRLVVDHPGATEAQVTGHLDLLGTLELYPEQTRFLAQALARSPASAGLHGYLRFVRLRDEGALGLRDSYRELVAGATEEDRPTVLWFAGLGCQTAAEHLVPRRQSALAEELYGEAADLLRESIELEPTFADSAGYYLCQSLAGRARLELERGDPGAAVGSMVAAVGAGSAAASAQDGLGNTPMATARRLEARLEEEQRGEELAALRAALAAAGIEGY